MFRTDGQGNLYIFSDNSGVITLRGLPRKTGMLVVVFDGIEKVTKELPIDGQEEAIINVSNDEIRRIGVGEHFWYADIISADGSEKDTIVYKKITIINKDEIW